METGLLIFLIIISISSRGLRDCLVSHPIWVFSSQTREACLVLIFLFWTFLYRLKVENSILRFSQVMEHNLRRKVILSLTLGSKRTFTRQYTPSLSYFHSNLCLNIQLSIKLKYICTHYPKIYVMLFQCKTGGGSQIKLGGEVVPKTDYFRYFGVSAAK